jgi:hypothetical protein
MPNQSGCGNVGPYPAAPSTPTAINSFPTTIGAGGNYQVTADCNLPSAQCITSNNSNTVIDFNGHNINGQVRCQFNCDGQRWYSSVAGAQLHCTLTGGNNACINIVDSGHTNPTFQLDHVTITNDATDAASSAFAFWLDWSGTIGPLSVTLSNITASMTAAGDGSTTRTGNFRVQGQANTLVNFTLNDVSIGSTVSVAQGLELFDLAANVYFNYFHWSTNTSGTDTPRAVVADGTFSTATPSFCTNVFNNYFDIANGRAFRPKNQRCTRFHDNRVDNISNDGTVGALHIADPDSTDNPWMDFAAENNTFRVSTGNVAMARGGSGITLQQNTVACISSCTGGRFMYLRTSATGGLSTAVIRNNPSVSGIGFTNENTVDTGATLFNCNSGTVNGAGTSTALTGC